MKITYILPNYWPAIGGCELHTRELVKRFSEKHEVQVITLINNQEDKLSNELWLSSILRAPTKLVQYQDNKAKVMRLSLKPIEKFINLPLARLQSPKLPKMFVSFLMERLSNFYMGKLLNLVSGSDVIHCVNGGVSYLSYAAFKTAKNLGIPFIFTPVLHLHQNNSSQRNAESKASKESLAVRTKFYFTPRGWTDNFWYRLCHKADILITMTDFERTFFIERGISDKKIYKVGVGPLIEKNTTIDFRKKYGLKNEKIVLFLGRNTKNKGIMDILIASRIVWEKYPDTHFIFAGPLEEDFKETYQKYSDSRIKVLGYVSDEEKSAMLRACDIFCMPSWVESLGGSFLEAWMFEKPIIGARIPPVLELTEDGKGGFLIDKDHREIAEKILILLKDSELCNRMGQWGKRRVLENYTWEIITKKIENIYSDLLKREDTKKTFQAVI